MKRDRITIVVKLLIKAKHISETNTTTKLNKYLKDISASDFSTKVVLNLFSSVVLPSHFVGT